MDEYEQEEMRALVQKISKADDLATVTTYIGHRVNAGGHPRSVTIKISDYGPSAPAGIRYFVEAEDEDGRQAGGNGHERLDAALAMVHWSDLDKDRDPRLP